MVLLHGVLDCYVYEAKNLPTTLRIQTTGCIKRFLCCGGGPELSGSIDPYVTLSLNGTRRLRTTIIKATHTPEWHERFEVLVADEADEVLVNVKDADVVGAEELGRAVIPIDQVLTGERLDLWLALTSINGSPIGSKLNSQAEFRQAQLHLAIQYRSVEALLRRLTPAALYSQPLETPRTYFPLRPGNRVTLYHDAHQTPGPVPQISLGDGQPFVESSAWDDIYASIQGAQRFIYITGWSVWTSTVLVRRPCGGQDVPSLGDLLLAKAAAGVTVLMLVWDDKTNNLGLHPGLMATHDQETFQFFKDSDVTCVLCPRQGGTEDSLLQQVGRGTMFTHHQKTVILDADPLEPSSAADGKAPRRRVIAYVGGLDLCDGRYDTAEHPLFSTTQPGGVHEADFHQACIAGWSPSKGGPREPWHDIHARVEGPAAFDVLLNFAERWAKQAGTLNQLKLGKLDSYHDIHIPEAVDDFISVHRQLKGQVTGRVAMRMEAIKAQDPSLAVTQPDNPESWSVQLFRSIDSDSASGFPSSQEGSYEAGLNVGKGKLIDASIHRAYVAAIRVAQHFIYIENQYFLGSAHLWDSDRDTPAPHLVPAEIMLKICSKIAAGEPFRVYVVVPMYPEGLPNSGSVQAILYFQAQTMRMMYRRIADAIAAAGLTGQVAPTDYLQFYCLGQREAAPPPADEGQPPADGGDGAGADADGANGTGAASRRTTAGGAGGGDIQSRCSASRRFMIYVHSKMMIVDDTYILLGSANINQRSMDGTRDTEIAIGAYQPGRRGSAGGAVPRGQVAGFLRALLLEHTGALLPCFEDLSSLESARALRSIGDANWADFAGEEVKPLRSHLMTYPVLVAADGSVSALPGAEEFPDTGGVVLGTRSNTLPGVLTS